MNADPLLTPTRGRTWSDDTCSRIRQGTPKVRGTDTSVIAAVPHGWTLVLWPAWLLVLILLFVDIVMRRDIRWTTKVIWMVVIVLIPFVGSLAYAGVRAYKRLTRRPSEAQEEPGSPPTVPGP